MRATKWVSNFVSSPLCSQFPPRLPFWGNLRSTCSCKKKKKKTASRLLHTFENIFLAGGEKKTTNECIFSCIILKIISALPLKGRVAQTFAVRTQLVPQLSLSPSAVWAVIHRCSSPLTTQVREYYCPFTRVREASAGAAWGRLWSSKMFVSLVPASRMTHPLFFRHAWLLTRWPHVLSIC